MREHVYLFELDSVRKTDDEIIKGQKALYDEIVTNGNVVIMTYNQLVDSRGFFSLFDNEEYQKNIIKLFENGAIRISQYGETRSLAQYLMNSVDAEKKFIYSALPVKFYQKRILALIKRSLMYSDLSEIYEFSHRGYRSDDDVIELFQETDENQNVQDSFLFREGEGTSREDALLKMRDILENLYWLLRTVLRLSSLHDIYIHPKDPEEYKELRLHNIIDAVIEFHLPNEKLWSQAIAIIKNLECYGRQNDNRSVYLREIKSKYDDLLRAGQITKNDKEFFQYAEAIINLCYNYACEISICNISKHYNANELSPGFSSPRTTFYSDFMNRLRQDWNHGDNADSRYLTEETTHFDEFSKINQIPDFKSAVRYTEYVSYKGDISENTIHRYEYKLKDKKQEHKNEIFKSIGRKVVFAVICLGLACLIECGMDLLQNQMEVHVRAFPVVETLTFLFITEMFTSWISYKYPQFLSLSDALGSLGKLIKDSFHILYGKSVAYSNQCEDNIAFEEKRSRDMAIEYILSPELRKYIQYYDQNKSERIFDSSTVYPIADVHDQTVKKQLVRLEELYQYHFGMVYRSPFNTMIVDPIEGENELFPYERIVPSSGKDGVVMVTKYHGNFILLKQFRHAPRIEQYSFPRGFAEPGCSPEEDAKRELEEEIGAVITKPLRLIGRVIPDSGVMSGMAYVYLADIDSYQFDSNIHEGIKQIVEIPLGEMEQWIAGERINDGFSLSAYALYKDIVYQSSDSTLVSG